MDTIAPALTMKISQPAEAKAADYGSAAADVDVDVDGDYKLLADWLLATDCWLQEKGEVKKERCSISAAWPQTAHQSNWRCNWSQNFHFLKKKILPFNSATAVVCNSKGNNRQRCL